MFGKAAPTFGTTPAPSGFAAPAPAFGTTSTPAPGFSFGGATPAAPAGATALFGSTPAAAPATAFGTTPASQPAIGGFTAAPATGGFATTPATGGFTTAPATGGFGSTTPSPAPTMPQAPPVPLPDFDKDLSPGASVMRRLQQGLSTIHNKNAKGDALALAQQEVSSLLSSTDSTTELLLPSSTKAAFCASAQVLQANLGKVQQEAQQSAAAVYKVDEQKAQLTPEMQRTVANLATTLGLDSWLSAVSLFQAAMAAGASGSCGVETQAYQVYLTERGLYLQTLLLLVQYRWYWKLQREDETDDSSQQQEDWTRALDEFVQANHGVLVTNLLGRLQESIQTAMELCAPESHNADSSSGDHSPTKRMKCQFLMQEAHMAATTLFFLAYQQQQEPENGANFLEEKQVLEIIDAIQALTNLYCSPEALDHLAASDKQATPGQDPWSGYSFSASGGVQWDNVGQQQTSNQGSPVVSTSEQRRDETDLVLMSGRALRCVGVMIMTVQCTLDSFRQRSSNIGSNTTVAPLLQAYFGPTDKLSLEEKWKRRDILGLLMSFYATSCVHETAMAAEAAGDGGVSPRHRRSSIDSSNVHRKTWADCIESALVYRSFSFARTSLVAVLRMPTQNFITPNEFCSSSLVATVCTDVSDFYVSALAGFASQYLDMITTSTAERPMSRAKWLKSEESDLEFRKTQQEQQRQFQQSFRTAAAEDEELVPDSVDMSKRPDCMDDIVAFCVAVCSLGPEYSVYFWSRRESFVEPQPGVQEPVAGRSGTRLVPSKALRELARAQVEDDSLMSCYVAFLAALAQADDESATAQTNGADVIHEMLSTGHEKDESLSRMDSIDWPYVIQTLRYYVRQLGTENFGTTSPSKGLSSGASQGSSTAYYYHTEQGGSSEESSAWSSWSKDHARTESTSTRSKARELGEESSYSLLSHLALIRQVASKSAAARLAILSVNLPIRSTDGSEVVGQNSTLNVLFALAGMPVSPEVRGAVFETMASLFSIADATSEQKEKLREMAVQGWELLELCQILPIYLFEQYPTIPETADTSNIPKLHFPPSSMAMVKTKPGWWIPAKTAYAIVYEMEFIEAAMGIYPSTCGFMCLLQALFTVGGSPTGLGSWRVRTGCTPYIEYVTQLVLPRVTGTFGNFPALPFRSVEDKSRMSALGLAVVESVLASCVLPTKVLKPSSTVTDKDASESISATRSAARGKLGHKSLADLLTVEPSMEDAKQSLEDFRASPGGRATSGASAAGSTSGSLAPSGDQLGNPAFVRDAATTVPPSKSPGFTVLADILSSSGGDLLAAICIILTKDQDVQDNGMRADEVGLVAALFGKDVTMNGRMMATSPSVLRPGLDSLSYHDAILATEDTVLHALRVFCAAVAREDTMYRLINSMDGLVSMTPVLRFQKKSATPKLLNIQPRRIKELLMANDVESGVLSSITGRVGSFSSDSIRDENISVSSVVLLFDVASSENDIVRLCHGNALGQARLARMFAVRLLALADRCSSTSTAQLLRLVMNRLLSDLRGDVGPVGSLARIMLGLPSEVSAGQWKYGSRTLPDRPKDCFDSILLLLRNRNFVFSNECSEFASDCFEVVYRLCTLPNSDPSRSKCVAYSAERLRSIDFWKAQLLTILSSLNEPESPLSRSLSGSLADDGNFVHSAAWVLQGAADELRLLVGLDGAVGGLPPQPHQLQGLLSVLYAAPYELVATLIRVMPRNTTRVSIDGIPDEALRKAKTELPGAPEVVQGYKALNCAELVKTMKKLSVSTDEGSLQAVVSDWNSFAARSCSLAHLSGAIYLLLGASLVRNTQLSLGFIANIVDGHKLLAFVLEKFASESSTWAQDEDMTVSRNLALAALVLTQLIRAVGSISVEVDGPTICSLLARSVVNTGSDIAVGFEYGPKLERTTILVTALSLMLQTVRNEDLREGSHEDLRQAAVVLSQLSSRSDNGASSVAPSKDAVNARACLSIVLNLIGQEQGERRSESLVVSIFSLPVGDALVKLLGSPDSSIPRLLQTAAQLPFGAETLLDLSVLRELRSVAERCRFEASQKEQAQRQNFAFQQTDATAPPVFLLSHVELMSTLLAALPSGRRRYESAIEIVDILGRYDFVLRRLVNCFPTDGDVLRALFQCLAQVEVVLSSDQAATGDSGTDVRGRRMNNVLVGVGCENEVVSLTMHMAEYPLPSFALPVLPYPLTSDMTGGDSNARKKSWWDGLNVESPPPTMGWAVSGLQLTDDIVEYASLGASMVRCGLSLFRDSLSSTLSNGPLLARALCRCTDAIQALDKTTDETSSSSWQSGARSKRASNQTALRQKLEDCIVEILLILIAQAKEVNEHHAAGPTVEAFFENVKCALNHCALDSSYIKLAGLRISDENRPDCIQNLAEGLRKELSRGGYRS